MDLFLLFCENMKMMETVPPSIRVALQKDFRLQLPTRPIRRKNKKREEEERRW
jgi:hypothetical protein